MGADVGRWGGSRGTIRLESAAAAWTNRQTDWGSEGLKPVKAWGGWGGVLPSEHVIRAASVH